MRHIHVLLRLVLSYDRAVKQRKVRHRSKRYDPALAVSELLCSIQRTDQSRVRNHVLYTVLFRIHQVHHHSGDLRSRRSLRYAYMWTTGNTDDTNRQSDKRNGGKKFEQEADLNRRTSDEDAEVSLVRISHIIHLYLFSLISCIEIRIEID